MDDKAPKELRAEVEELRVRLKEAEQALEAIRAGQAESLTSLREANLRTTSVLESIADAFYSLDDQWRFVGVNPAAERAPFGRPANELLGKVIWDVFPSIVGTRIYQHYLDAVEKRSREHYEARSPLNGRWYEVFMFPREGALDVYLRDIDDRKQAEEALRQSEARHRLLADTMLHGVVHQDSEGKIVSMNAAAERILGKTRQDFLGSSSVREDRDCIREDGSSFPGLEHPAMVALRTSQTIREVVMGVFNPRESAYRWIRIDAVPVLPPGEDRPYEVYTVFADITDRKRAEKALRESEERFRTVIENSRDGINMLDLATGRYIIMSPAQIELTGFSAEEMSNLPVEEAYERVHPEDRELSISQQREVAAGRDVGPVEYRWMVKSGQYRWFSDSRKVVLDRQGKAVALVGVSRDITEQKRNEEALKKRELQLRVLIENVSSGVALVDENGRFTQYNQQFLKMFGLPADATVKNVNDANWAAWKVVDANGQLLHVDDHPVRRAARSRQPVRGQLVGVRCPSAENLTWMLISAAPILCEDGSIEHLICTYHDITDQHRMQEALLEADRRKNEFMAVLSHELRNPLAPIRNSVYILERATPGGDQARRALTVIDRQTRQLARLVDDLLDVTRITQNKIHLQRQTLELNDVVRHTVEDQRTLFDKAEVILELHPAPGPVFVNADWNRLAQIVGNLLQNAVKFTDRGGIARVSVHGDTAEKRAIIQVTDTGMGMAPEIISRLFQPFIQADSSIDRTKSGLGLGLALVKGLVELHGGEVTAHSDGLGKGAQFEVRLPLVAVEKNAPRQNDSESATRRRRRVLIVEDNIDAADSLREALEFDDHEVAVAYNGPDGLAKARQFRPEVLLCDIGLPGMDGYQVARAFRADDALKGAFLVALTGYARPEDLAQAHQAGFEHHLAKPPSLEKLEKLLADIPEGKSP
jgi:PAS domain S-box-containing protein